MTKKLKLGQTETIQLKDKHFERPIEEDNKSIFESVSKNAAKKSGIQLDEKDAAIVKGMLLRGDRQHDVASWFGVNGGRIGEINKGRKFREVEPEIKDLPPSGPYISGKTGFYFKQSIIKAGMQLKELKRKIEEEEYDNVKDEISSVIKDLSEIIKKT